MQYCTWAVRMSYFTTIQTLVRITRRTTIFTSWMFTISCWNLECWKWDAAFHDFASRFKHLFWCRHCNVTTQWQYDTLRNWHIGRDQRKGAFSLCTARIHWLQHIGRDQSKGAFNLCTPPIHWFDPHCWVCMLQTSLNGFQKTNRDSWQQCCQQVVLRDYLFVTLRL